MTKKKASTILICFFILVGLISFVSPIICTFLSEMNSTRVVIDYEAQEAAQEKLLRESMRSKAEKISDTLNKIEPINFYRKSSTNKPQKHKKVSYKDGDMIGYITIPRIDSILPIYEGKSDAILQKGIGHIRDAKRKTCSQILGVNKHCVLAGHSGLSSARLFSDLDKLRVGDVFYIKIKKEYFEYKIIETCIKTPKKAETSIQAKEGKDLCTLVTCTPVPLNNYRLLIKGERVKYDGKFDSSSVKDKQAKQSNYSFFVSCLFVLALTITLQVIRSKGKQI